MYFKRHKEKGLGLVHTEPRFHYTLSICAALLNAKTLNDSDTNCE